MNKKIGTVAFAVGMLTLAGAGGGATELPPEATLIDFVSLLSLGFLGFITAAIGVKLLGFLDN